MRWHLDRIFSRANRRDLLDLDSSILGNAQKGGDVRVDQQRSHYADPQIGRPRQDRELEVDHAFGESLQNPGQNIGQETIRPPPERDQT